MQREILCIHIIRKMLLVKCLIWFSSSNLNDRAKTKCFEKEMLTLIVAHHHSLSNCANDKTTVSSLV